MLLHCAPHKFHATNFLASEAVGCSARINNATTVNYGGVDRVDIKERREFYTSQAAIDAVRSGQPIPSGTVVTMVHYKAKQDDQGNLLKGPDGHLVKGEITQFGVMEKRTGWGAEYPPELRNGEWEYQPSRPTGRSTTRPTSGAASSATSPMRSRTTCSRSRR